MRYRFTSLVTRGRLLAALSILHQVAAAAPAPPGSGTILQQAQPVQPSTGSSSNSGLTIEQSSNGELPAGTRFRVARIEIAGNTRIDTAILHDLVAAGEGHDLSLRELGALIVRISTYYHMHGYPLARAIIPAQTLHEGVVRVEVIEARYGGTNIKNSSRVSTSLIQATLEDLKTGDVVTTDALNHDLLLLTDIPGVAANATLKPGTQVGTSDLQVDVSSPHTAVESVTVDNSGDRYSGIARLGVDVSILEPFHQGDVLGLSALSSGSGMNYGRFSYDGLLDGAGTRAGLAYSALHYRLSGRLSDLDAYGTAQDASVFAMQPLIRAAALNLHARLEYNHLQLDDEIGANDTDNRRHLDTLTGSLSGDIRDGLLVGATNTWNVGWTYGHVGFSDLVAQASDASGARTQGDFSKWNLSLGRLQGLDGQDALYIAAVGQWANGNLDPSQQLIEGGPGSIRAYDVSALAADTGYQLTLELRHAFAHAWHGQWQSIVFVDDAHVNVDRRRFAPGPNSATLSGTGVGINWAGTGQWGLSVTVATPFGAQPSLVGDRPSARAWAQISKGF